MKSEGGGSVARNGIGALLFPLFPLYLEFMVYAQVGLNTAIITTTLYSINIGVLSRRAIYHWGCFFVAFAFLPFIAVVRHDTIAIESFLFNAQQAKWICLGMLALLFILGCSIVFNEHRQESGG